MSPATDPATGVEIRRNVALSALIGLAASVLAVAYLWRASGTGSTLDWLVFAAMTVVGLLQLAALVDGRTPLLLADEQGVRIRLGREWLGLPWEALDQVVVEERDTPLRDGRLVLSPRNVGTAIETLERGSRRQVAWLRRLYGAPLAVPLAITTRCASADLHGDLTALAAGRTDVVTLRGRDLARLEEVDSPDADERAEAAEHTRRTLGIGELGTLLSRAAKGQTHDVDAPAPGPAYPPVAPVRAARPTLRAEITRDARQVVGSAILIEDPGLEQPDAGVRPFVRPTGPLVIDELEAVPATEPVVGPEIVAARTRAGLTVEELSDRTRIRPHVLEAIEVDDFGPCGGDFYARGHLRTLARFLGLDVEPLLAAYDDRYAHAPINARRVFEAELATGMSGGMRATVGGPRWSLLVGAVLCLLMVWGVARFFTDAPTELASPSPVVSDSAGLAGNRVPITSPLTTTKTATISAVGDRSRVVVRDRTGEIIWSGLLHRGEQHRVAGLAPLQVEATDAGATRVAVGGQHAAPVGEQGKHGSRSFG